MGIEYLLVFQNLYGREGFQIDMFGSRFRRGYFLLSELIMDINGYRISYNWNNFFLVRVFLNFN